MNRKRTGVDHNIGAKLPVLMHKARLQQIQIRVSDSMRFLYPPLDTNYKERLFKAICDEGYGQPKPNEEQRERWKANIMGYGISEKDAEAEIARELEVDFLTKGDRYQYPVRAHSGKTINFALFLSDSIEYSMILSRL